MVSASQLLNETLLCRFPSEMAARPTTVIGTGVDTEKFSPSLRAEDWAAAHGVSRPVILYVGRLSEKKGVEFLLTAMATEPLRSMKASLVIIGRGPLEDRLQRLCRELDLGNRVRFLPPCDHATLGAHIAAADVLCLPSVVTSDGDQEGRPTVLVEAASCGVPAVASDVGGVRDWIDHGRNGLLVPPGRSIGAGAGPRRPSEATGKCSADGRSGAAKGARDILVCRRRSLCRVHAGSARVARRQGLANSLTISGLRSNI